VKRDDRNMGEGTMVLLCRLGLLVVGERTIGNSCSMAGQLGYTADLVGGEGGDSNRVHREREERVLIAEGSNTKLRIIRRLNLLVSQPFLYICVGKYKIVMVEIITQEYDFNISYIVFL
jgi:hypothetical protein